MYTKDKQKKLPSLTKQGKPWLGTPFTISGQEIYWALFFHPRSSHKLWYYIYIRNC